MQDKILKVESYLKDQGIAYVFHEHPAVFTCEEAEKHCAHIPGVDCKNLFVRDKKKRHYFLVTVPAEQRVDLKELSQKFGVSNLGFASPADLESKLGTTPGSVSPCALLNDPEQQVTFYLAKELYDAPIVNFHPNLNTASLEMTQAQFHQFLASIPHQINLI